MGSETAVIFQRLVGQLPGRRTTRCSRSSAPRRPAWPPTISRWRRRRLSASVGRARPRMYA